MVQEAERVATSGHVAVHDERMRWHAELEILFDTVRDLGSALSTQEVIERLIDRTQSPMGLWKTGPPTP